MFVGTLNPFRFVSVGVCACARCSLPPPSPPSPPSPLTHSHTSNHTTTIQPSLSPITQAGGLPGVTGAAVHALPARLLGARGERRLGPPQRRRPGGWVHTCDCMCMWESVYDNTPTTHPVPPQLPPNPPKPPTHTHTPTYRTSTSAWGGSTPRLSSSG